MGNNQANARSAPDGGEGDTIADLPAGGGAASGIKKHSQEVPYRAGRPRKASGARKPNTRMSSRMTHVLTRVQQQMVDTFEQEGPGAKLHQNKKQVLQVALRQVKIFLGLSRLQQKECIEGVEEGGGAVTTLLQLFRRIVKCKNFLDRCRTSLLLILRRLLP